jgi:anti-sigma factor RsiW
MNGCHLGENRLSAWLDDELDALTSADVERHLAACTECAARADVLRTLSRAVRAEPPLYFSAPPTLQRQIRAALAREANVPAHTRWLPITRRLAVAAAILLAAFIGWALPHNPPTSTLATEVLSAHLRSLMADHLLDVPSSDRHTVKPWFAGKIDFSPDVRDAAADGFPLQGGRLEYLDGRTVAALVYRHDKHLINVFVWPTRDATGATPISASLNGYQTLHWTANGLTYWAVSDASESTLRALQTSLTR